MAITFKTNWQKCYDMESEITYLGESKPVEHYFSMNRRVAEGVWDVEEDECYALVEDNKLIDYEGYSSYPSDEEKEAMEKILMHFNKI